MLQQILQDLSRWRKNVFHWMVPEMRSEDANKNFLHRLKFQIFPDRLILFAFLL